MYNSESILNAHTLLVSRIDSHGKTNWVVFTSLKSKALTTFILELNVDDKLFEEET